jgi:branched-chain amino acid transport system permease protein
MNYWLYVATVGFIWLSLVLTLDVVYGRTGLFTVAHGALFGLGAYGYSIIRIELHAGLAVGLLCGATVAVLGALVVAIPSLRVRDDYLVVGTLGFQLIATEVMSNLGITGGSSGLTGVPTVAAVTNTNWALAVFAALALVFVAIYLLIVRSPIGRTLALIRTDDAVAASLGRNVVATKVLVFAVTGGLAGIVGGLYASFIGYLNPDEFDVTVTITLLTMLIVGGLRSLPGMIAGVALVTFIPELLAYVGSGPTISALQQAAVGLILLIALVVRPSGLFTAVGAWGRPGHRASGAEESAVQVPASDADAEDAEA